METMFAKCIMCNELMSKVHKKFLEVHYLKHQCFYMSLTSMSTLWVPDHGYFIAPCRKALACDGELMELMQTLHVWEPISRCAWLEKQVWVGPSTQGYHFNAVPESLIQYPLCATYWSQMHRSQSTAGQARAQ